MSKNEELIQSLAKSRIFFGNLAQTIRGKHGAQAANKYLLAAEAADDAIRALRESDIVADSLPKLNPLDISNMKLVSNTVQ